MWTLVCSVVGPSVLGLWWTIYLSRLQPISIAVNKLIFPQNHHITPAFITSAFQLVVETEAKDVYEKHHATRDLDDKEVVQIYILIDDNLSLILSGIIC